MEIEQRQIVSLLNSELSLKLSLNAKGRLRSGDVKGFCLKVLSLIRKEGFQNAMKNEIPITLQVELQGAFTGKNIFNSENTDIESEYLKEGTLIKMDLQGVVSEGGEQTDIMNSEEAQDFSERFTEDWIFFVEGDYLTVFANGKIIKSLNVFNTKKSRAFTFRRPISEYRSLINRHFEEEIARGKLDFWHKKSDRILRTRPENIFGRKLCGFLEDFVSDGHVEFEKNNANTSDRTDISITTLDPKRVYIIEVKWLGKSYGGSEYTSTKDVNTRANEGIYQLEEYLKKEPLCSKGILVIYDARNEQFEIEWLNLDSWHDKIDKEPFLLYLQSLSASKLSEERVASLMQKPKSKDG